ncbi:hypothetical protein SARC_01626 [Sphaeroforma arctica JP610]|uniref:thermospermine synthase n=1 Tax=Sphaeroforma arctica JP610 TaxID=667725 RepID=A0A0L0GBE5_9EUKA|nr:hypothetical protein SARC_01626 [Sphaeroforma arctica JP610]KNC86216.1 hypothetical protein SARC_01626 [Sphaeroforma arctica JP610]|eukprot:XP_014160118.1 hypothetical protein SARC_01626 [Sphaeroforma arctica JP610]
MTSTFYGQWFHEANAPGVVHCFSTKKRLFSGQSDFQTVDIIESEAYGKMLLLDDQVQSAKNDEHMYHESLVQPAMLSHPNPKNVYIGGGGEGATAREVLRHPSVEKCVMADIDPIVCKMCEEQMEEWHEGAYTDPRFELVVDDAKATLEKYEDGHFDVIILDLSDPLEYGPCYTLYSKEFYNMCYRKLSPGGVFVTQSGPASLLVCKDVYTPVYNTLKSSDFDTAYAYQTHIPSFAHSWGFNMATKTDMSAEGTCLPASRLQTCSPAEIDAVVDARLGADTLKHYDGVAHLGMFNLSKSIRTLLNAEERVISEKTPIYVSYCDNTAVAEATADE